SAPIAVLGEVVSGTAPTPSGISVNFSKPFNATVLNLFDANGTYGPPDVTVVGPAPATTVIKGTLLLNATNTGFTFVKTGGPLTAGTYTLTVVSGPTAFVDLNGVPLDGNGDGTPGDNYVTTFTIAALPVVVGVPDFSRGPNASQNVNL